MHISKHIASLVSVLALFSAGAAERISFSSRPMSAGRASLTEDGFAVSRTLGTANATPELSYPIELTYESFSEKTGLFGFAWRSPQLESSAACPGGSSPADECPSFTSEDDICLSEYEGSDRCGPTIIPSDECFGMQDSCNNGNQDVVE